MLITERVEMNKYGIWIIPEKPAFDELERVIKDLAVRYEAPTFSPHLTLCGRVESTDDEVQRVVSENFSQTA